MATKAQLSNLQERRRADQYAREVQERLALETKTTSESQLWLKDNGPALLGLTLPLTIYYQYTWDQNHGEGPITPGFTTGLAKVLVASISDDGTEFGVQFLEPFDYRVDYLKNGKTTLRIDAFHLVILRAQTYAWQHVNTLWTCTLPNIASDLMWRDNVSGAKLTIAHADLLAAAAAALKKTVV